MHLNKGRFTVQTFLSVHAVTQAHHAFLVGLGFFHLAFLIPTSLRSFLCFQSCFLFFYLIFCKCRMQSPTCDPGLQAQAWEHGESQEVYLAAGY